MSKVWLILGVLLSACGTLAAQRESPPIRNIVLVHGAWADGSGWKGVYDILVKHGYRVSIVQEPETSFREDVAATKRVIAQQDGPCILVAHSYFAMAKPSSVIFSIGRGRNQHPRPEVVDQIRDEWSACRIACTQLTTHCAAQVPSSEPVHLNREFAAGRRKRFCCAASLVIDLDAADSLLPTNSKHQDFITVNVPTPLCRAGQKMVQPVKAET